MKIEISGYFGFWVFAIVYFVVDSFLHWKGCDTFFWRYSTPEEKEIQRIKIERMRG